MTSVLDKIQRTAAGRLHFVVLQEPTAGRNDLGLYNFVVVEHRRGLPEADADADGQVDRLVVVVGSRDFYRDPCHLLYVITPLKHKINLVFVIQTCGKGGQYAQ